MARDCGPEIETVPTLERGKSRPIRALGVRVQILNLLQFLFQDVFTHTLLPTKILLWENAVPGTGRSTPAHLAVPGTGRGTQAYRTKPVFCGSSVQPFLSDPRTLPHPQWDLKPSFPLWATMRREDSASRPDINPRSALTYLVTSGSSFSSESLHFF